MVKKGRHTIIKRCNFGSCFKAIVPKPKISLMKNVLIGIVVLFIASLGYTQTTQYDFSYTDRTSLKVFLFKKCLLYFETSSCDGIHKINFDYNIGVILTNKNLSCLSKD